MTKTSEFCSSHQEVTCKSCLQLNLIILTDFRSFTVNEDKLQHWSIFKISAIVQLCYLCQNLIMTKTPELCSIYKEMTYKSCLHWNLIILTDFHSLFSE